VTALPSGARPLSPVGKALVSAEVLVAYGRARWLMWRRPDVRDTLAALRGRPRTPWPGMGRDAGLRLGRAVDRTLRLLPTDSRCLVQALTLIGVLARRGVPARLVIGTRTEPAFAAHAWVELDGQPLLAPHDYLDRRLVEL
jgi:transglutaminase-like putative cysteine protease